MCEIPDNSLDAKGLSRGEVFTSTLSDLDDRMAAVSKAITKSVLSLWKENLCMSILRKQQLAYQVHIL